MSHARGLCPMVLVLASTFAIAQAQPAASKDAPATVTTKPAAGVAKIDFSAPLPNDPRFTHGQLDNGLKYMVMRHATPPGRAAIYMQISTGSLNETDKQRGIAHYLEHMAFNGSENFAPGSVINFFQSLGMTFGRDQNAFTSFDRTTYILELPDTKPETIGKATLFFSDVAGKLKLLPNEIESERQVILEERRTRAGAQNRVMEYVFPRLAPGSLFGYRMPIGTAETIQSVQQQDFLDYYTKYYVPSNMTIIAVADCDPQVIIDKIKQDFSAAKKVPRPADQDAKVTPTAADTGIVATDPELTRGQIQITRIEIPRPPARTMGEARREIIEDIATAAFDRAVARKRSQGKMSFLGGGAGVSQVAGIMRQISLSTSGEPAKWKEMLTDITTEARRAVLHGLSASDVEAVKKDLLASAEQQVREESTSPSRQILGRVESTLANGEVVMSPQQQLDMMQTLLPTITAQDVSKAFAELFDLKHAVFAFTGPSKIDGMTIPTEAELAKLGRAALSVSPEADQSESQAKELLSKVPAPGTYSDIAHHSPTDVYSAWLSNNVRFNYRFMDYQKNSATIAITLAGGELFETAANRGISQAASIALGKPATSTLSSSDIDDLTAGKAVRVRGRSGADGFTLDISGNPGDLETGLTLAHLLMTDPKIEESAFSDWKTAQAQGMRMRSSDVQMAMIEALPKVMYDANEPRTKPLTQANLDAITLNAAQKWLIDQVRTAPMEVTVVGDIDRQVAMDLVAKYIGSLPKRDRIAPNMWAEKRKIERSKNPTVDQTINTKTDKAMVMIAFPAPDTTNVADARAMDLAASVLSTRMIDIVREKEQLVYSARTSQRTGREYPGFGSVVFGAPTDPHKVDRLVQVVTEIYNDFAKTGPTADELKTAHLQAAKNSEKSMKEPGFWLARLSGITYRGTKLDDIVNEPAAVQATTAEQVKAAFNKYYKPEALMKVLIRPGNGSDAAPADGIKPVGGPTGG
jgi:zinc protease